MGPQLQAIVTLLALINPVMCVAIFMRVERAQSRQTQVADATRAAVTVLVILVLAALFGAKVLHAFGVSLDAFSVAGGGVLAWIGFSMLRGGVPDANEVHQQATGSQVSLTPLILFAASPGTITGVITLTVAHSKLEIPVSALVAVGVATATMWLMILMGIFLGSRIKSESFVRDTVTRFMGLIVVAMGVQFALTGIISFLRDHGAT